jgi:hypothetical protein
MQLHSLQNVFQADRMVKAKKLIRLSFREDAAVIKAAKSDVDARPLTDKQWDAVRPSLSRGWVRLFINGLGTDMACAHDPLRVS